MSYEQEQEYWQTLAEEGNDPDGEYRPDYAALRERDRKEREAEKAAEAAGELPF